MVRSYSELLVAVTFGIAFITSNLSTPQETRQSATKSGGVCFLFMSYLVAYTERVCSPNFETVNSVKRSIELMSLL